VIQENQKFNFFFFFFFFRAVGGNVFGLFIYLCSVQSRSLNRSNIYIDFFLLFLFFGWAGLAAAMLWCVVVKERWPI
jgi:hypothetical protein